LFQQEDFLQQTVGANKTKRRYKQELKLFVKPTKQEWIQQPLPLQLPQQPPQQM
jgi:hypothetical protein